jgi:YHS domain-containing protein
MNKKTVVFIAAFLAGTVIALVVRTARHDPYEKSVAATSDSAKPVNSVCPICGMDVDPDVSPALYEGKTVGFGCNKCPPKFAADPDTYGQAAMENRVVK